VSETESVRPQTHRETGIVSIGSYVPRTRLKRSAIATANGWANPGLKARAKGTRAICSHDEDSLTMAVAAARQALASVNITRDAGPVDIQQLILASTTLPFSDRQNATIVGEALGLNENLHSYDISGSLRCGSSALMNALRQTDSSLVVAADKRQTQPASIDEMTIGDAATAVVTGSDNLLAKFVAASSVSIDLVDHYRDAHSNFDYTLEERWVRDEGYLKIIPTAIRKLLQQQQMNPIHIDRLIVAGPNARTCASIAQACEIPEEAVQDNLNLECGDTGSAHALLMLAHALEQAQPGEKLLVVSFGQGCDTILLETTNKVMQFDQSSPLQTMLESGIEEDNYQRYLSFNKLVKLDWGMRSERDNRTALSAFYRHRKTVTSFIGGRCTHCDTPQFPRKPMCANPECRASNAQKPEHFKDKAASVKSFTEDWLALSYNPPLMYGNVHFEGGGIVMMEFADFQPGELNVGTPLSMQFRIKDEDSKRGFKRYFWKATPLLP